MHKNELKMLKFGPSYHNLYIFVVHNYFDNYMTPNSWKYRKNIFLGVKIQNFYIFFENFT